MTITLQTVLITAAALCLAAILVVILRPAGAAEHRKAQPRPGVSIAAAPGSVVTVRKVGPTTLVDIRPDIHDHWDLDRGIEMPPTPVEITRREEPELYAEYMSPETSAKRKYEIVDQLYAVGLSLPLIPDLHQKWIRERERECPTRPRDITPRTDGPASPAEERTPVNPEGGRAEEGVVYRRLAVDESLWHESVPSMDGDEPLPDPEEESANQPEPIEQPHQ